MEREAFEKLYETYYMRVYSYVITLSKDQYIAEDITQETFYKAFSTKSVFRGKSNLMTWLCTIARNLFIDEMRRQSKNTKAAPDENTASNVNIELEIEDRETFYRIHLALNKLEAPYRQVFELRIFGELSFREIGDKKGLTVMTSATLFFVLMMLSIGFSTKSPLFWKTVSAVSLPLVALIWLLFLFIRYLKSNGQVKAGICTAMLGIFSFLQNISSTYGSATRYPCPFSGRSPGKSVRLMAT